jgi:hypothetical protein
MTNETPTPQPRTYSMFLIRYPHGDSLEDHNVPRDTLLDAVVDCGIIPGDIKIYYLTEVPADIRNQALSIWAERIEAEVQQIRAAEAQSALIADHAIELDVEDGDPPDKTDV